MLALKSATALRAASRPEANPPEMSMKKFAALLLCAALVPAAALADEKHGHGHGASQSATAGTDGQVMKIDKGAGKITLKHGEIKNLGMPPMTMVFQVKEPALLDKVKVGDKVKFEAVQPQGGGYTVTAIEPAK